MEIEILATITTMSQAMSFTHETDVGTDCLIVTHAKQSGVISAVTFDGNPLTEAVTQDRGGNWDSGIWYLLSPPIGSFLVVLTGTGDADHKAKGINLKGVIQSSPVRDTDGTPANAATSISSTVSSAVGDLCMDAFCLANSGVANWSMDAGQTLRNMHDTGNVPGQHAVSTEPGAASVTMGWSGSNAINDLTHCMASFIPAAAAGEGRR